MDNIDYMDCGLYGFLLLRFLEKESAKTAAARNPKGDKSGRGLASLRAAAWALLVNHILLNPGSELWLLNTANRRAGDHAPGPQHFGDRTIWPASRRLLGFHWGFIGA